MTSPEVTQFAAVGRLLPFYFYHTSIQGLDASLFHVLLPLHFSMMHDLPSLDLPQSASDLNIYTEYIYIYTLEYTYMFIYIYLIY